MVNKTTDDEAVAVLTVAQFLVRYHMSNSTFYQLLKAGQGPRLMRVGSKKILILKTDAQRWERQMSGASETDAA
ncbi:hypothetical protein PQR34_43975 [Paraburkholderia sediminicola]|uniref:helix-turn-helix transcriptional regulator n=1 Tax=Paraburkholderia sediminicola TaxID=458836 RepID=UPI0038B7CAC9